jgi:hypothetical protein
MKLLTTILALACSSALLCSAAWAQGNTSRTYRGTNGPPAGQQPGSSYGPSPTPDNFVVNVYGQGNDLTFVVTSGGGDICGRSYYFTGTVIFPAHSKTGSIGGPMLRCTDPGLVVYCNEKTVYQVTFTGTVERGDGTFDIRITYPDEKWLKEDCKNKRTDVGTEQILLTYAPPTPPEPTIREMIDQAKEKAADTMYKSVRGGEWLKNRPR